jgi:protein prenyltransferase alpha subunit repeat containing protein 1
MYKLYLAAVALFKSARNSATQAGTIDALTANPLIASSSVILLANSAHQTALNMRKRLVQRGFLSPQEELDFIDALLRGSRECVKQSIIWAHRRWLFRCLYGQACVSTYAQTHIRAVDEGTQYGDSACFPNMPPDAIRSEFRLVSLACEKYPRNYHAWTHWRFCMNTLYFSIQNSAESDSKGYRDYIDVLADTIFSLRCWVEQHVSDHSAVHQLCSLARGFGSLPLQHSYPPSNDSVSGNLPCSVDAASSWAHAMSLLALYPTHESLWMYLRGVLFFAPDNSRKKMLEQLRSLPICESQLAYRCLVWSARLVCFEPHPPPLVSDAAASCRMVDFSLVMMIRPQSGASLLGIPNTLLFGRLCRTWNRFS